MALRVRADGTILCAAMHPALPDDRAYIDDGIHYKLSVCLRAIVTEPWELDGGLGGHARHGRWWWVDDVPAEAVIE